jgi:hypothetical protein
MLTVLGRVRAERVQEAKQAEALLREAKRAAGQEREHQLLAKDNSHQA